MKNSNNTKKIKEITEEFFKKMTIPAKIEADFSFPKNEVLQEKESDSKMSIGTAILNIKIDEPQILIGEKGQTLLEIQHLLGKILNKKIEENFYVDLDICDYKKKKIEYLKNLARDLADEVVLTKEEKNLFPMPAYERRIIHLELADRKDVVTESQGEEPERKVIIRLR